MLKNYFILTLRNFWKHKLFSLINISGLAIGISASLVIYLIVQYEFSFDQFHPGKDKIFRVVSEIEFPDMTVHNSGVPVPTVDAVRKEVTGLEQSTHFLTTYDMKVSLSPVGTLSPLVFNKQKDIIYADENYFELFQYQWLAGSAKTALKDPYQVVLTESRAQKYFGNVQKTDIIGKTIDYNDSLKIVVSGVVRDITHATDFRFKEFISRATIEQTGLKGHWAWDQWGNFDSGSQFFVKLAQGTAPSQIEQQLVMVRDKHREKRDLEKKDDTKHFLQPLTDIHFNRDYDAFENRQANSSVLYSLLAVAAFLLALGCINFINLNTAQSVLRTKEIGIRKTLGSAKSQLVFQFLSETFAFTLLATLLSLVLAPWLLNVFKDFIPEGVGISSVNQPHVWVFLSLLVVGVTALSGFYPALILTKFQPVTILKNQRSGTSHTRNGWLRKTLTVSQFVITQVLLIATLVVSRQVQFSLHKDLGYKKEAIVFFNTEWNIFSNEPDERRFVLLEKLKSIPEIERVSLGTSPPASDLTNTRIMNYQLGDRRLETMVETKFADAAYFDLYKLKLVAGKNLEKSDTTKEFVINETYARLLGFSNPQDVIGKFIERDNKVLVTGVVADFHTKSTHTPIKPLAFSSNLNNSYTIHMALRPREEDPGSWKSALDKTEKLFKELYPEDEFSYKFFDESIAAFYSTEQNIIRLLKWASGLCVFISCLGLLGLVIFTTNQRTKEIGVRKVLGATIAQILSLLSRDIVQLVILAFIISSPAAWWGLNYWLATFEYRVNISWFLFAAVGVSSIAVALLTIGFHSLKMATSNPVDSLRTE
jgi:putative ABC transport system permease protein